MSRRTRSVVIAGIAVGAIAAILGMSEPVEAGTCTPVKAKGRAKDIAMATTLAQINLTQKAAALGGKVTQTSSNCVPGPTAVVCKISAVVCPKK
jgi:hypothetical protein